MFATIASLLLTLSPNLPTISWTEDKQVGPSTVKVMAFFFSGNHCAAGSGVDYQSASITGDSANSPPTWDTLFDPLTGAEVSHTYTYLAWDEHSPYIGFEIDDYWQRSYGHDIWRQLNDLVPTGLSYTRIRDIHAFDHQEFVEDTSFPGGGG